MCPEKHITMSNVKPAEKIKNKVLSENVLKSINFYESDLILKEYLARKLSNSAIEYMLDKWEETGSLAALVMDELSLDADQYGPTLIKRNNLGETIDEVKFHPSYDSLMQIAIDSEMFTVKWDVALKSKFQNDLHKLGFSSGYIYAMSEIGQYCPLCMTDGVARLIDIYCDDVDKKRLLPKIATKNIEDLSTGAMFLTEKSGGSDVGRNIVKASKIEGTEDLYELKGEKWFCSNVNAEIIFALARTDKDIPGTKGLSIFLIEKYLPNGEKNPLPIIRLKEKLGVRSMASAECKMEGTIGKRIGEEFKGFKIMTDMINLSRLYNSVAALSGARRALIEAYTFNLNRKSFGKEAINHALIRDKFFELGSLNVANFYLTWRAIESLDKADNGDQHAANLSRILTPMVKKWSAEKAVYIVRESMELMGGMGYIEDGVMPKIMRDVMVLPIWEGAGNIMTLDMLRASFKSEGLKAMVQEVKSIQGKDSVYDKTIENHLNKISNEIQHLDGLKQEELELKAKHMFNRLTTLYQLCVCIDESNNSNATWMNPTKKYLQMQLNGGETDSLLSVEEVKGLIGWEI
jgi:alkylation response protein AidB-like acyl-CoA dehydrogenase